MLGSLPGRRLYQDGDVGGGFLLQDSKEHPCCVHFSRETLSNLEPKITWRRWPLWFQVTISMALICFPSPCGQIWGQTPLSWEGCSKDKDSGIILVSRANRSKSSDDNGDDNGENCGLPFPSKFPNIPWNRCYFLLYKDDRIAAKGGKVACSSHT